MERPINFNPSVLEELKAHRDAYSGLLDFASGLHKDVSDAIVGERTAPAAGGMLKESDVEEILNSQRIIIHALNKNERGLNSMELFMIVQKSLGGIEGYNYNFAKLYLESAGVLQQLDNRLNVLSPEIRKKFK